MNRFKRFLSLHFYFYCLIIYSPFYPEQKFKKQKKKTFCFLSRFSFFLSSFSNHNVIKLFYASVIVIKLFFVNVDALPR